MQWSNSIPIVENVSYLMVKNISLLVEFQRDMLGICDFSRHYRERILADKKD